MKFSTQQIRECAAEILEHEPHGIRFSDLCKRIQERAPESNLNTIRTTVVDLVTKNPNLFVRPSRGVIILKRLLGESEEAEGSAEEDAIGVAPEGTSSEAQTRLSEQQFYEPFSH